MASNNMCQSSKNYQIIEFLCIIIIAMKNESRNRQEKVRSTGANFYNEERAISQIQIEQKCIHLQTVLLLTQLNSAYFQLRISLMRVLTNLEKKYFSIKMKAFLKLNVHKRHYYDASFKQNMIHCLMNLSINTQEHSSQPSTSNNIASKNKTNHHILHLQDLQSTKNIVFLNTTSILKRFSNKIKEKRANHISSAFCKLVNYHKQVSLLRVHSNQPSKIETIDTRKSEENRSKEKRNCRKLYSLQKSKGNNKNQQKIKPQNYRYSPKFQNKINSAQNQPNDDMNNGNEINRLLQKNAEIGGNDRKNRFTNRNKSLLRSTQRKKQNASMIINTKQQTIIELQFLKAKYTKLITQFNSFSSKFLKVISQQQSR